jgi:YcxB-like protein
MKIPEEDIQVHYTISSEDLMTYYEDYAAWWRKTPDGRRFRVSHLFFYLSLAVGPLACFLLLNQVTGNLSAALFTAFVVAKPWTLAVPVFHKRRYLRQLQSYEGFAGEHTSRITAEGISDRTTTMEWTVFWPYVKEVAVTSHHILFVTGRRSGHRVFPIPRHAFADVQEANAFVERAGLYWKRAVEPVARSLASR